MPQLVSTVPLRAGTAVPGIVLFSSIEPLSVAFFVTAGQILGK